MAEVVQIFVDNLFNGSTCYAGQTLAGRVQCDFNTQKRLRAVKIKFEGKCNTSWTQFESQHDAFLKDSTKLTHVQYRAEEIYFIHEYNLVGDGNEFTLRAGRYTYPFSYILPQLLPSSFTNDWGKVTYTIKASVDCPWQFDDHTTVMLNLISPLDLNSFPHLRQPAEVSADKTMFSWNLSLRSSGPVSFKMWLPLSAYTPGQQVKVTSYVQNLTHISVEKVIFKIVKLMEFFVHYPKTSKKSSSSVIVSRSDGGIGAHGEKKWTSSLTIPTDDPFPNMVHCKLINISYELQGEIVVPFPHTNLSVSLPLMIGNVPMVDINTGRPLVQTNVDHPYPSAPPLLGFSASAPPTYEQSQLAASIKPQSGHQRKSSIDDFEII